MKIKNINGTGGNREKKLNLPVPNVIEQYLHYNFRFYICVQENVQCGINYQILKRDQTFKTKLFSLSY